MQAFAGQGLRRLEHAAGGFADLIGALRGVADVDGDVGGAAGRGADALGDILSRAAPSLDCGRIEVARLLMRSMVWLIALIA